MRVCAAIAAIAALAALAAGAPSLAAWEVLRKNDSVSLSIDPASVERSGDEVSFQYLVDYAKSQTDFKEGVAYRSVIVRAQVRCKGHMLALGNSDLYSGPGGTGVNLASVFPERAKSKFRTIESGTSDVELLRRVCAPKSAPAKK